MIHPHPNHPFYSTLSHTLWMSNVVYELILNHVKIFLNGIPISTYAMEAHTQLIKTMSMSVH